MNSFEHDLRHQLELTAGGVGKVSQESAMELTCGVGQVVLLPLDAIF